MNDIHSQTKDNDNFVWPMEGDVLAVYIHMYRTEGLNYSTLAKYAQLLGTTKARLRARVRQVKGIDADDPGVGLSNAAVNTIMALKFLKGVDDQNAWAAFINTLWP